MINSLILERTDSSDEGTFGLLHLPNRTFFTLELPWRDNIHGLSCIPVGEYRAEFTYSPAFKRNLYVLLDVKDRTGIRIHSANMAGDVMKGLKAELNGCIALGERRGKIAGQKALLASKQAVTDFERLLLAKPFQLTIINGVGHEEVRLA